MLYYGNTAPLHFATGTSRHTQVARFPLLARQRSRHGLWIAGVGVGSFLSGLLVHLRTCTVFWLQSQNSSQTENRKHR